MLRLFIIAIILTAGTLASPAQSIETLPAKQESKYRIYLKQPAREIKFLMYEKNFTPIHGTLSEDKKSIIMNDYAQGNKVRVKVIYDDNTEEEFTKNPCFIDPIVM